MSGNPDACDENLPDRRIAESCQRHGVPFIVGKDHLSARDYKRIEGLHWNAQRASPDGRRDLRRVYESFRVRHLGRARGEAHPTAGDGLATLTISPRSATSHRSRSARLGLLDSCERQRSVSGVIDMNHHQMERSARIFVAGHRGLVGSAVMRHLRAEGYANLLTATREQLDLRDQAAVNYWFRANRPEYVFLVAGTVGGILANSTRPAEFLYDNMMIHGTVVHAAHLYGVKRLLYLGSSCIYPRECPQPMKEEYLLSGPLESTNEAYALAKIAGIKLCQSYRKQYGCDFIAAMPTNLYGPQDNFDLTSSHVLPALIRKFHDAKMAGGDEVVIWGTGTPRREFLHVDDLADACLFLMSALRRGRAHQRRHRRRPLDS